MDSIFHHPPPSEDYVSYSLYFPPPSPPPPDTNNADTNNNANTNNSDTKNDSINDYIKFLQENIVLILSELNQFLDGYIWQKELFKLRIVKNETDPSYSFLHGRTIFSDCIEDEWFIVFLLRHISKKFPSVVIKVTDNDGEFLLIEAAMQIPSWMEPSNTENRVFIYQNDLHLIIPSSSSEHTTTATRIHPTTERLSIEKAIQLVRNNNISTKADDNIQSAVFQKIREYPDKIKENIHHARCHIPRSISHILYHNPQLIAPAVEAFYTRDPIALKACQKMEKFPPSTSITATVKFTKTLYAQIIHQKFNPPKPFKLPPRTSNKFPAAELGMKLACGFEILCSDKYYTKLPTRSKDINIETYPFDSDPAWRIFHANLLARDYYRGNLPGSNAYKKLDEIAKEQFLQNKIQKISSEEDDDNEMEVIKSPMEQINEILDQPMIPDEVLMSNLTEDDESWLKVDPKQLDDLLESSSKGNYENYEHLNSDDELNTFDLSDMIDKLEGFIDDENAGIEGAEFSDEHYSDGDYDFDDFDMDDKNSQINFNPSNFLRIMRQTLGLTDEEYREMANVKIKQQQNLEEFPTESSTPKITEIIENDDDEKMTKMEVDEKLDEDEDNDNDIDMETYYQTLSDELSSSKIFESFIHSSNQILNKKEKTKDDDDDEDEDDEELNKPVNINLNLAANVLESFKAQQGLPGPIGNLISRMRVGAIPVDSDDDDDYIDSSDDEFNHNNNNNNNNNNKES
ncbi:hypothetical protein Glove_349g126 [Diversispora epigaea]|uniref:SGT1-domain-containing protein n=1 Tax=Diversispora epigaea TaxID=1348612 RepID=A0A397HL85_9GLOM|nr:hypothetical protein Glove_349g126 [Diversispora epigaea]